MKEMKITTPMFRNVHWKCATSSEYVCFTIYEVFVQWVYNF